MKLPAFVGVLAGLLLGGAVLAFGLMVLWAGSETLRAGLVSLTWPTVEGKITRSEVEQDFTNISHSSGPSTRVATYTPVVAYSYRVGDSSLTADGISFQGMHSALGAESVAAARLRDYPVGATVTVHYDPRRPHRAVLEPGADFNGFWGTFAFAGFFIFMGSCICWITVRSYRGKYATADDAGD